MTLDEQGDLMTELGKSAVALAPPGWTLITITIDAMGNSCTVGPVAATGGRDVPFNLTGRDGLVALRLRHAMFRPSVGTWYRAILIIDSSRQLEADFDYDAKPYEADDEGTQELRDLLMYDHELYPRDTEHLPSWHPAKV